MACSKPAGNILPDITFSSLPHVFGKKMCSKLVVHTNGLIAEGLRFLPNLQSRKTRLISGSIMFSDWRLFISVSVYFQMGGAKHSGVLSGENALHFSVCSNTLSIALQMLNVSSSWTWVQPLSCILFLFRLFFSINRTFPEFVHVCALCVRFVLI